MKSKKSQGHKTKNKTNENPNGRPESSSVTTPIPTVVEADKRLCRQRLWETWPKMTRVGGNGESQGQ
jgi:hypothetical protein